MLPFGLTGFLQKSETFDQSDESERNTCDSISGQMASMKQEVKENAKWIVNLLQQHGYTINEKKSCLDPSQRIDYLGFCKDLKVMELKLQKQKINSITRTSKGKAIKSSSNSKASIFNW